MDDKLKSAAYFNRHSSTSLNRNGYWSRDYRVTTGILAEKRVRRLADIGCGNGAFLALFHRVAPQVQLSGLDLSREMVLRARQRLPEAGILEGDLAVVEQAQTAVDGQIVVAVIENAITLKRFYKEADRIRLQPENAAFQPIYSREVTIVGILSNIVRTY